MNKEGQNMTIQTHRLKLPMLPFLCVLDALCSKKLQNEPKLRNEPKIYTLSAERSFTKRTQMSNELYI